MSNLIDSLKDCTNSILGIRDKLGAVTRKVSLVTRSWTGRRPGDGEHTEEVCELDPQPGIKEISHDVRVTIGGAVQQGDIILYHVSKQSYPTEDLINCEVEDQNIEKFYRIGNNDYRVIHVKERHLTWDLQVRKLSDQSRKN